jgi:hypothetical protein
MRLAQGEIGKGRVRCDGPTHGYTPALGEARRLPPECAGLV